MVKLCPECIVLCASVDPPRDVNVPHHGTVQELTASAGSGCQLCRVIARACREKFLPSADQQAELSSQVTLCIKGDAGIEISLAGPTQATRSEDPPPKPSKPTPTYVIFQEYTLPCESTFRSIFNDPAHTGKLD